MDDIMVLIAGIVGLISGILFLFMPKWFRNLWKVRIAYEIWGEKAASRYYFVLGVFTMATGLWLIIKSLSQLFW